jgi:hypothetical protein
MNKRLSGKGYIRGGEGHFLTSTGDLYHYHEGVLTLEAAWPSPSPEPNQPTELQGVIEMSDYLGTFELQPLYDSHQSFYGKAFVERWDTEYGMKYVLKSYGTVVAVVTPLGETGKDAEAYRVEIGMGYLSATTLRHVKEFLAQTDDVFKGITLSWLRKAVKDGNPIVGAGTAWRKGYALNEL